MAKWSNVTGTLADDLDIGSILGTPKNRLTTRTRERERESTPEQATLVDARLNTMLGITPPRPNAEDLARAKEVYKIRLALLKDGVTELTDHFTLDGIRDYTVGKPKAVPDDEIPNGAPRVWIRTRITLKSFSEESLVVVVSVGCQQRMSRVGKASVFVFNVDSAKPRITYQAETTDGSAQEICTTELTSFVYFLKRFVAHD